MIDAVRYSAAHANVRGAIGRLLPDSVWHRLLSASTLEDILSVLSTTAYSDAVLEQPASLEQIERQFRSYLARHLRSPLFFVRGRPHQLLDWLWRRLELDDLTIVLRGLHNHVPSPQIRSSLLALGPASDLDWQALSTSGFVSNLIERLRGSLYGRFYARALDNAYGQYERQQTVFVLEVSVYLAYYRRLRTLLNGLRGRDRKYAGQFVSLMIDSRNLMWAFRYRVFFGFRPETILSYTLPRGGRVDATVIRRIADGAGLTEIVESVWGPQLPGLERLRELSLRDGVVELELILRRYLYSLACGALTGYPLRLGTLLAYVVLLEAEVDDLVTVSEGKANEWSTDSICSRLIGTRE